MMGWRGDVEGNNEVDGVGKVVRTHKVIKAERREMRGEERGGELGW